jgi:hypothetical protein
MVWLRPLRLKCGDVNARPSKQPRASESDFVVASGLAQGDPSDVDVVWIAGAQPQLGSTPQPMGCPGGYDHWVQALCGKRPGSDLGTDSVAGNWIETRKGRFPPLLHRPAGLHCRAEVHPANRPAAAASLRNLRRGQRRLL